MSRPFGRSEEEIKESREKFYQEKNKTFAARERLFDDSIALMECDDRFAERVQSRLENMKFASRIVNFVGAGGSAEPIDAGRVQFYLRSHYDICVRKENIAIDFDRHLCTIRLNSKYTAKVPIEEGTGVKSLSVCWPVRPGGGPVNVLCYGDSNTFGYDPESGMRYPADVRWAARMQELLGESFHVIEEGCNGRTTVFDYPEESWKNGLAFLRPCLNSHKPLDIVILMLGSNDLKEAFHASPRDIADGTAELVRVTQEFTEVKQGFVPKIILVSPPHIGADITRSPFFGEFTESAIERSKELAGLYRQVAEKYACEFFDAAEYVEPSETDSLHLTAKGHRRLANRLARRVRVIMRQE